MPDDRYKTIKITEKRGDSFLPRPTARVISEFEGKHGIQLPESYCEFCLKFGAGELGDYYRIASPLDISSAEDLARHNRRWHGEPGEDLLGSYGPPEVTEVLYVFGSTIGGEGLAWKLDEVKSSTMKEYAIFRLTRSSKLLHEADEFGEFILNVCLKPRKQPSGKMWKPKSTFSRFMSD